MPRFPPVKRYGAIAECFKAFKGTQHVKPMVLKYFWQDFEQEFLDFYEKYEGWIGGFYEEALGEMCLFRTA